jgi:hypothetical protein
VDDDVLSLAGAAAGDRDVRLRRPDIGDPPHRGCGPVAHDRVVADGEQGGLRQRERRHVAVADRVHATHDLVEPSRVEPLADRRPAEAERLQLTARDDAALAGGQPGDPPIDGVTHENAAHVDPARPWAASWADMA